MQKLFNIKKKKEKVSSEAPEPASPAPTSPKDSDSASLASRSTRIFENLLPSKESKNSSSANLTEQPQDTQATPETPKKTKDSDKSSTEKQAEKGEATDKVDKTNESIGREPEKPKYKPPKKGDYQVQVHVIEGRKLRGRDSSGLSDPLCEVSFSLLGETSKQKQHTQKRQQVSSCIWNQLMFFDFKLEYPDDLYNRRLTFTVYDVDQWTKNQVIGVFELDIDYVFNSPSKDLFRNWVALYDPTGKYQGVQGYLRISVTILGPGDEQIIREEDETGEEEDFDNVLLPANLSRETKLLRLQLYSANDLPVMDSTGKGCDPYAMLSFASGGRVLSKTVKNSLNPVWEEEMRLPIILPSLSDKVSIAVWDYDRMAEDELVGQFHLSLKHITENSTKFASPRWYYLYGAPRYTDSINFGKARKRANQMNAGRIPGSAYRGKVLLSISQTIEKIPGMIAVSDEGEFPIHEGTYSKPKTTKYTLRLDLYKLTELPISKESLTIKISCGNYSLLSGSIKYREGNADVYHGFDDIEMEYPIDAEQIPDVFVDVHIKGDKERLSFVRIPAQKILGVWDMTPHWETLVGDVFGPASSRKYPGNILYGVSLGTSTTAPKRKTMPDPPPMESAVIVMHLYQARYLPAGDSNGLSDPYVVMSLGASTTKSAIRKATIAPVWYQTLAIDTQLPVKSASSDPDVQKIVRNASPYLTLCAYDYDTVGEDDFLGRVSVHTASMAEVSPGTPAGAPKWYKLSFGVDQGLDILDDKSSAELTDASGNPLTGEILCGFQIIRATGFNAAQALQRAPDLRPACEDCILEVVALGMRDLAPFAMLPVMSPYALVSCGSADVVSKKSKRGKGPNPYFGEVLKLPIKLAKDPTFAPAVTLLAFDHRFGGVLTPLIGSCVMPFESLFKISNTPQIAAPSTVVAPAPITIPQADAAASTTISAGAPPTTTSSAAAIESAPQSTADTKLAPPSASIADVFQQSTNSMDQGMEPLIPTQTKTGDSVEVAEMPLKSTSKEVVIDIKSEEADLDDDLDDSSDLVEAYMKDRKIIDNELEDTFTKVAFDEVPLYRGKARDVSGKSAKLNVGQSGGVANVGKLKGAWRLLDSRGNLLKGDPDRFKTLSDSSLKPTEYIVRVYMLRGINISPKDDTGKSDPFLKLRLGKIKIDDEKSYQKQCLQPEFYKLFTFPCTLPGSSSLHIELWDHDTFSADDLIGKTKIDIENRWYNSEWQSMAVKPVERRTLWHPLTSAPQGKLEMWIDIIPKNLAEANPPVDISRPPPEPYEIRLIAWKCRNLRIQDPLTKQNDAFVVASLEGIAHDDSTVFERRETDTHWRAKKGNAEFNYRMVFEKVLLPMRKHPSPPRMKIQVFDQDVFNMDDSIGEATIPMSKILRRAVRLHRAGRRGHQAIARTPRGGETSGFWLKLGNPGEEKQENCGEIYLTIEVMHSSIAEKRPAGKGRHEPNQYPFLPPPTRMQWSWNPFTMLKELVGPELFCKVLTAIIVLLLLSIIIAILPIFFGDYFSTIAANLSTGRIG